MVEKQAEGGEIDPRIRRTRRLLHDSLCKLLKQKRFDDISVQDIADAATVNRATFYAHYGDKFSLLECMVGERFHELLTERQVQYDGTCASSLTAVVLAVCDYLDNLTGPSGERPLEPHMESAILAVLRRMFLEGTRRHPRGDGAPPEMVAAAAGWAIYGAAKEWTQMPKRPPAEQFAETVKTLVVPVLGVGSPGPESAEVPRT